MQVRTPRPMGTTEKGFHHSKEQSTTTKQELEEHIVNHYMVNNFTYCNKYYTIEQLSQLTNIPIPTIMGYTHTYANNIQGMMDKLHNGDSIRALLSLSINYALEDRGRAIEQYSILAASQQGSYKPFISSEVTKALKQVMDSGQNISLILKGLSGGNTINILNQIGVPNEGALKGPESYVSVDDAVMLIKAQGHTPLGLNAGQQQRIYEDNQLDLTPEVCALKQEGVDTSKEALTLNKIVDLGTDTHIDRRALDFDFDLDSDEMPN